MKVSDYIAALLAQNGIDKVFGYIGGNNAHIMDSIDRHAQMEMVNTLHEQGAGFAAEGYARITGRLGAATATSGPGATNLITPMASCFYDSVPVVFITGQVNTYECKNAAGCEDNAPVRQIGFQEADIVAMVKPITKYAVLVDDLHDVRYELEKALYLAQEGRKGPVLIDIPIDLQYKDFEPLEESSFYGSDQFLALQQETEYDERKIQEIAKLINSSKRPVVLIGGGVRTAGAETELTAFLEKTNIPVTYSLMGKDLVTESYRYNLGFIGAYGTRHANLTLANADLLLILGSRLDARQVGRQTSTFARAATIIQVDIDKHELGRKIKPHIPIRTDVKLFLQALNEQALKADIAPWQEKVLAYKSQYPVLATLEGKEKMPNKIIALISQYSRPNDIISVDVGLHQMWSAQSFAIKEGQRILFSGGLGAMGFALPTAIGASLGTGKRVIVIAGDGGFQMNIQELELLHRRKLPVKIFIMNNAFLGMVRQMQDEFLGQNYVGTQYDYSMPNFKKVAEVYGIISHEVSRMDKMEETIAAALANDACELVDIHLCEDKHLVEPRMAGNRPMEDMRPFLERDALKTQMMIDLLDE
jgi:acetolactate synthase-1/2/3 large subunit